MSKRKFVFISSSILINMMYIFQLFSFQAKFLLSFTQLWTHFKWEKHKKKLEKLV